MQICAAVRGGTTNTPTLNGGERGAGGVWIVLFLKVTLFEDHVCGRLKLKVVRIKQAPVIQKVDNAIHRIIH